MPYYIGDSYGGLQSAAQHGYQMQSSDFWNALQDSRRQQAVDQSGQDNAYQRAFQLRGMLGNESRYATAESDRKAQQDIQNKLNQKYFELQQQALNANTKAVNDTEGEKSFSSLYGQIQNGGIRDIGTLADLEQGKLSSDQFSALRRVLGNNQVQAQKNYTDTAVDAAATATPEALEGIGSQYEPAITAAKTRLMDAISPGWFRSNILGAHVPTEAEKAKTIADAIANPQTPEQTALSRAVHDKVRQFTLNANKLTRQPQYRNVSPDLSDYNNLRMVPRATPTLPMDAAMYSDLAPRRPAAPPPVTPPVTQAAPADDAAQAAQAAADAAAMAAMAAALNPPPVVAPTNAPPALPPLPPVQPPVQPTNVIQTIPAGVGQSVQPVQPMSSQNMVQVWGDYLNKQRAGINGVTTATGPGPGPVTAVVPPVAAPTNAPAALPAAAAPQVQPPVDIATLSRVFNDASKMRLQRTLADVRDKQLRGTIAPGEAPALATAAVDDALFNFRSYAQSASFSDVQRAVLDKTLMHLKELRDSGAMSPATARAAAMKAVNTAAAPDALQQYQQLVR